MYFRIQHIQNAFIAIGIKLSRKQHIGRNQLVEILFGQHKRVRAVIEYKIPHSISVVVIIIKLYPEFISVHHYRGLKKGFVTAVDIADNRAESFIIKHFMRMLNCRVRQNPPLRAALSLNSHFRQPLFWRADRKLFYTRVQLCNSAGDKSQHPIAFIRKMLF